MDDMNRSLLAFYRRHRLIYALFQQYECQPGAFWFFQGVLWVLVLVWMGR